MPLQEGSTYINQILTSETVELGRSASLPETVVFRRLYPNVLSRKGFHSKWPQIAASLPLGQPKGLQPQRTIRTHFSYQSPDKGLARSKIQPKGLGFEGAWTQAAAVKIHVAVCMSLRYLLT